MSHWLDGVAEILISPELDLKRLAEAGKISPKFLYQHCDLSKCDLRGQDLTGIDFTGSNLEGALLDRLTKIDPEFDPRNKKKQYHVFYINKLLLKAINEESYKYGYTYAVWYFKWLFDLIHYLRHDDHFNLLVSELSRIDPVKFYACGDPSVSVVKRINIPDFQFDTALSWPVDIESIDKLSFMLLCAMTLRAKEHFPPSDSGLIDLIENIFDSTGIHSTEYRYFSAF